MEISGKNPPSVEQGQLGGGWGGSIYCTGIYKNVGVGGLYRGHRTTMKPYQWTTRGKDPTWWCLIPRTLVRGGAEVVWFLYCYFACGSWCTWTFRFTSLSAFFFRSRPVNCCCCIGQYYALALRKFSPDVTTTPSTGSVTIGGRTRRRKQGVESQGVEKPACKEM